MPLRNLAVHQFRSYAQAQFNFQPGVNVIVGPNGIGKTNLLEAIYVVALGNSFRVTDKQLVQHERDWFRIDATFDNHERSLRYNLVPTTTKRLLIDQTEKKRITRELRLPVVLFEPETLRMLSGSPARRRAYLDTLLTEWFSDGVGLLRRYERVLAQRNNLLKKAHTMSAALLEDALFAWDVSLAELASLIEQRRLHIADKLNQQLSQEYSRIAHKTSVVQLQYSEQQALSASAYLQLLKEHRRRDVMRAHTTIGPHRSDFALQLNGKPAGATASRGEQRSLVLALKFIEMKELEHLTGRQPLLLLDDVMSELDKTRQQQLLQSTAAMQSIITTTNSTQYKHKNIILLTA